MLFLVSCSFVFFLFLTKNVCSTCGDGICTDDESKKSCPKDCDEDTCSSIYSEVLDGCLGVGWKQYTTNVTGIEREFLFNAPQSSWNNGTIIVMHGGGGCAANICFPLPEEWYLNDILRGVPLVDFGNLALSQGYGVFSLNSAYNRGTDDKGSPIGKRFESLEEVGKENHDLKFFYQMIQKVIPSMRPSGSKKDVFVTGISNGGFMTTFTSTTFSQNVTSFVPVSSGDPYGMYFDMSKSGIRQCTPGNWVNTEPPYKTIEEKDACASDSFPNELPWPIDTRGIAFKQFYHEKDLVVDITCKEKIQKLLVQHGFKGEDSFVIKGGIKRLEHHYWQEEYNQPILNFFHSTSLWK